MVAAGPEQLRRLAVALKEAGDRGNLNALRRGLRGTVAVGIPAVRAAALTQLPKSGGLAQYEATQKIRVAVVTSARSTGVRIIGKASLSTDTGTWRHPIPDGKTGRERTFVEQSYGPAAGWWTKTWQRQADGLAAGCAGEMKLVEAKIAAEVG